MRNFFVPLLILILFATSCKKYNNVNNNATIKTPFTLYMGGYSGTVQRTNDGVYFTTEFSVDQSAVRHLEFADSNVVNIKQNSYYSKNAGSSFNISNAVPRDYQSLFYQYFLPNGLKYDASTKILYLCGKSDLMVSTDFGVTYSPESAWGTGGKIVPTSITELDNGDLFIGKDSTDLYKKTGGVGNWNKVNTVTVLPSDSTWYLAHSHDTLIAIDYYGRFGVKYSTDGGLNWNSFTGVSNNGKEILFGNNTPETGEFYIGRDSGGLFKLNGTAFVATGSGIPTYAKVSYVVSRQKVYRTNEIKKYIFCATNMGLFESQTNGQDWSLVRTGNFSTLR